jgi:hypothetical protein
VNPAEARLEEADQRKAQEPELDPLDSHRTMLSQSPAGFRYTSPAVRIATSGRRTGAG